MAEYKKSGSLKALIVTGCMAERYREEITKEIRKWTLSLELLLTGISWTR